MEAMNMNNMGMMNQFPGINGYYNPMMQANYQSYLPQGFVPPSNKSTLTDEEIKRIREASKNGSALDITLDPVEFLKELCNHKENYQDIVRQVTDGTGDVYCWLCDTRWNADVSYEDAVEVMKKFNDIFQTIKWVGNLPIETAREYSGAAAVVIKATLPLYEYAMKNLNKASGVGSFKNANDANVFAMYDSIMGNNMYNPMMMGMNNMAMMGQQPMNPYSNMGMSGMNNMTQPINPYANNNMGMNNMAPSINPYGNSPMNNMGMNNMGMNNMGMMGQQSMNPYAGNMNMGMNNMGMMGQTVNPYVNPMQANTNVTATTQPPTYSPMNNAAATTPDATGGNTAKTEKTFDLS